MDDDEFGFSGHALDDLPLNELQELETTAIQATQHQSLTHITEEQHDSDYGFDDGDEIINLDDAAGATRFGQIQQNYDHDHGHDHDHGPPLNGYKRGYGLHDQGYGDALEVEVEVDEPPQQSQVDASRLLKRIKHLELEKKNLNARLQTATDDANRKAGEADNLRRAAERERREAQQRLDNTERQYSEAKIQLKAEKDSIKQQLEATKTSNAFDEHDAHQAEQARRTRRALPSRSKPAATTAAASPTATPRKPQKTLQVGDGFDDEDVPMVSPSKRREKSKAATPRQAHKRKRQAVNDSPIAALQILSAPRERTKATDPTPPAATKLDVALLRSLWKDDARSALLQRLLAHRCSNGTDRVLEALTQHAFPSQPEKRLSSIVYDSLSGLRLSSNAHHLALRVCRVFFELWTQCLLEKYYAPIFLIVDALHFILACEPPSTAVATIEQIVPLIVDSVERVAHPVAEAATKSEVKLAAFFSPKQQATASDINVEECLELLYLVATSCVASPSLEALTCFWRTMPYEIVLLLLHRNQPLPQLKLMLRILSTSALPTSLGPTGTKDEARDQVAVEADLIMRLTSMFTEAIEPLSDPKVPSPVAVPEAHIWQLRLKVLDVLTQFSTSDYGCAKLASDHFCVGRLVRYLNHCVASLYTRPLSPTQSLKIGSINATMKLVHHIVTRTKTPIKSKLKGVEHAYHVALTRITFSERLVLEAGVESQVMDMAHDILDEDIGPEEGEAFYEVFPSGNTT